MKVFCCQLDIVWESKPKNYRKVEALLEGQSIGPDSLIVLPEMFSTGFSMDVAAIKEGDPSESESFLAGLATKYQSWLIGGLVDNAANGLGLNEAVAFNPEGHEASRYTKIHPFSIGSEAEHYQAGEEVALFNCQGLRICPFICYDLRFPEVFRIGGQKGAQVFVVIANWPNKRTQHWVTLLQARAIENLAYVIGVNRCGQDPHLAYPGRTLVVNPHGKIIADAGESEGVISADLDATEVLSWRSEFPALDDMRPEFLGGRS